MLVGQPLEAHPVEQLLGQVQPPPASQQLQRLIEAGAGEGQARCVSVVGWLAGWHACACARVCLWRSR